MWRSDSEVIADKKLQQIKNKTLFLKERIQARRLEHYSSCNLLRSHGKCRHKLSVMDDLILKSNSAVIPRTFWKAMFHKVDEDNLGLDKCKKSAGKIIFWPQTNHAIANTMANFLTQLFEVPTMPAASSFLAGI